MSKAAEFSRVENQDEIPHGYQAFFAAVRRGDWRETEEFLTLHHNAITTKDSRGTALHNAVQFGKEQVVEELVKLMTEEDLEIKDRSGWTALALAAKHNIKMVECMVTKNRKLLGIVEESTRKTPILIAARYDRCDIVRYLYSLTPPQDLMPDEGRYGSELVSFCLYAKQFDIAWELLQRCPRLACTPGFYKSPLFAFACVPSAFPSGTSLKFWQHWIYNCIHIESDRSISEFRIRVQNQENELGKRNCTVFGLLQGLPSRLLKFLGINLIRELKLIHVVSRKILDCMSDVVKHLTDEQMKAGFVKDTVDTAVENGIAELVISLCKVKPDLLFAGLDNESLFHKSIGCRQEKVYSLIYGVGMTDLLTTMLDSLHNSMQHYAGMLSPLAMAKLDCIPGAALQMQRERQWYKEVESIVVPLSGASTRNDSNLTPPEYFTKDHETLHKDGQKWMKETAKSYTVVSALIITIMFAAAFTVPGGSNQGIGFPIFLNENLFMIFIASDAISLFSSTTSVCLFLGILTSRYAEDDFLKSLPTKMIMGLSTLFISIATMMVAFSSALFIMLHDKPWISYPIICLAGVPVILFIWMQFPLLVEIFMSTYGGGIFDRKVKRWI